MLRAEEGPAVLAQTPTPETPVILQVPVAVGAIAKAGPETLALKVMVEPRVLVAALALTATVGVALATVVV
jgi:hypothetical protein